MEQTQPTRRRAPKANQNRYLFYILIALLVVGIVLVIASALSAQLTLELIGNDSLTLEYGSVPTDLGVTAYYQSLFTGKKQVEAEVKVTHQSDYTQLGTYLIIYEASYQGRSAKIQQTITVVDNQAPIITLVYNENSFTVPGQPYQEEGFTAEDNYDGDITHKVERMVQDDVVIYRVKDSSGNEVVVTRTIQYGDQTAPVLTLKGDSTVTISAGTKYQEPGFTAIDNADGDITSKVTVTNSYNIYVSGTYTITYTVTDSYGNTATVTRTLVVEHNPQQQPNVQEPEGKVIYLTFDDGPSKYTLELLDILDRYNAKATFFVVGSGNTAYFDDIVNRGHAIAIHTMSHDYKKLYSSTESFFKEVLELQELIYKKTGVKTTLIRFPGGSSNTISRRYCTGIMTELTKAVEAQGFQYFDWHVDSRDASDAKTADKVAQNVINGVKNRKYSVVLQHDIKSYSVKAVEQIIAWGVENGYSFQALNSTSPTAHHHVNN